MDTQKKTALPDFANNPIVRRKVEEANAYLKTADLTGLYDDNPKKPRKVADK